MRKGQLLTRIISSGLLAVVLLATGAFLTAEGQTLGERTTHIAILLAVAGMGAFLFFGSLVYGYIKAYRMPV
ncbi:MAG: hypothetical protein ACETWE_11220 [Candidatus Bathyarchaeia archaeon]